MATAIVYMIPTYKMMDMDPFTETKFQLAKLIEHMEEDTMVTGWEEILKQYPDLSKRQTIMEALRILNTDNPKNKTVKVVNISPSLETSRNLIK